MRDPDDDPRLEPEAEAVRATYRGYAASARRRRAWAADNAGNAAMRDELLALVLAHLDAELPAPVLDVGCGSGWWLEALARHGLGPEHLHGVDLVPERIEAARRRLPRADLRCVDATSLPHGDGRMRLVLLFTVLSSLSAGSSARVLREVRRVLAPGGRVLVYEPRLANPANRMTRLVRDREIEAVLGPVRSAATLTVAPPLSRRLGRLTGPLYARLARVPALRTHRLRVFAPEPEG